MMNSIQILLIVMLVISGIGFITPTTIINIPTNTITPSHTIYSLNSQETTILNLAMPSFVIIK